MRRLRFFLYDSLFIWWDGLGAVALFCLNQSTSAFTFAIERMQATTLASGRFDGALVPEALMLMKDINTQRAAANETIHRAVVQLHKLDATFARIQHIGRKDWDREQ